jgi:hypothetical protein
MHDDDHGHSTAAWTGTTVMLLATAVACYAAVFGPVALMWGGIVAFLVGALVWYAMVKAGYGSDGRRARS